MEKLSIPRKLTETGKAETWEINTFVDASSHTYAAVIYLRGEIQDNYSINLVFSKNRLALIKCISIPRPELLALLIGVRATLYVEKELKLNISRRLIWCDSKCVLYWLKRLRLHLYLLTTDLRR